ncbi:hypothetical protein BB381_00040 [Campylobacter pinnipediorum subsp. caledonicus]|uniref:hypothetical protein n=1 Tax=Campylobacter pinnipediorum TaxID=1965231 RepID=UPI000994E386|nr:hypothetical protein [Campylobacter pinnipediorum]AQW86253.1 putative protein (DUF4066 domain) [Campylobacter pinnipediorum subsp. caledonicus]OPA71980.1 hypothetical protein BB381_00040 [Campylobacter pinnipediorum subsp. caledonicus]
MNVAIVMYDKMNLLSFSNVLSFLHSFDDINIKTCAFKQEIKDEFGVRIHPDVYAESIYGADIIIIPDGIGALTLRYDEIFLSWIKSASKTQIKIGLNLGTLILAGAGFLQGKEASIRGGYKNALGEYCKVSDLKALKSEDIISASEWADEIKEKLYEIFK